MKVIGDVSGIRYLLASTYLFSGEKDLFRLNIEKIIDDSPSSFKYFSPLLPEKLIDKKIIRYIRKKIKE